LHQSFYGLLVVGHRLIGGEVTFVGGKRPKASFSWELTVSARETAAFLDCIPLLCPPLTCFEAMGAFSTESYHCEQSGGHGDSKLFYGCFLVAATASQTATGASFLAQTAHLSSRKQRRMIVMFSGEELTPGACRYEDVALLLHGAADAGHGDEDPRAVHLDLCHEGFRGPTLNLLNATESGIVHVHN
jgi:hypothetical protein